VLEVVARRCGDVGAHARAVLSRTRDPRAAARYRALAEDCEQLVDAARAVPSGQ
jgi:hypothetical protein